MTQRETLKELILNAPKVDTVYGDIKLDKPIRTINTIVDHLLANGVIVSPCKVGDTVYHIRKFCESNEDYKEFYRPSKEFEKNCPYLEPQSWYDDCDKCKAIEDYDKSCYCTLDLKIHCAACKSRLAIQREKFTYGMMTRVFNTPMFSENTPQEDILYLTEKEAEDAIGVLVVKQIDEESEKSDC